MEPEEVGSPQVSRALSVMDDALNELRRSLSGAGSRTLNPTNADPLGTIPSVPSTSTTQSNCNQQSLVQSRISNLSRFRQMLPNSGAPDRIFRQQAVSRETREEFQPYPQTSRNSRASCVGSSGARRTLRTFHRQWVHVFYALAGPIDEKTPSRARKRDLESCGLGPKALRISEAASFDGLRTRVHELFPALQGLNFELLTAASGGAGKVLEKLSSDESILTVAELKVCAGRKQVFVRPATNVDIDEQYLNQIGENGRSSIEAPQTQVQTVGGNGLNDSQTIEQEGNYNDRLQMEAERRTDGEVILTMEDLRSQIYSENPGSETVFVQRDNFCLRVLGVYKNPAFNLLLKPQVSFAGELGSDVGALQREFFWCGIKDLSVGKYNGRLPFFEGEEDHKLPACDASLFRSGVFKLVGRFLAHSALHAGVAFVGLSKAIVEYFVTDSVDYDTPFTISLDDIPDYEIRNIIHKADEVNGNFEQLEGSLKSDFEKLASDCGFNELVDESKYRYMREHILYHIVIEKRRPALEAIKSAFRETPLLQFLKGREYLIDGLFPSWSDIPCNPGWVISKIECQNSVKVEYVKSFIVEECQDTTKIHALLVAWTGWALPTEQDELKVDFVDGGEFCFHSCFNQLEIPSNFTKSDIYENLRLTLNFGHTGFGSI